MGVNIMSFGRQHIIFLLLLLVLIQQTKSEGISKKVKLRLQFKSLLYEYLYSSKEFAGRKNARQCGGTTGTVCCTLTTGSKPTDCEYNTADLFKNMKKALMFKIYQIENFNRRLSRLNASINLIKGKASKHGEFKNTSDILLRALGGDKSNLKCKSDNVSDSEGSNRVLGNATTTLTSLATVPPSSTSPAPSMKLSLALTWKNLRIVERRMINL